MKATGSTCVLSNEPASLRPDICLNAVLWHLKRNFNFRIRRLHLLVRKQQFYHASTRFPSQVVQACFRKALSPAHTNQFDGPPTKVDTSRSFQVHPSPLQLIPMRLSRRCFGESPLLLEINARILLIQDIVGKDCFQTTPLPPHGSSQSFAILYFWTFHVRRK